MYTVYLTQTRTPLKDEATNCREIATRLKHRISNELITFVLINDCVNDERSKILIEIQSVENERCDEDDDDSGNLCERSA